MSFLASTVAWATLTPEELWKSIVDDTEKQFGFELKWYGFMCNIFGVIFGYCELKILSACASYLQQKQ